MRVVFVVVFLSLFSYISYGQSRISVGGVDEEIFDKSNYKKTIAIRINPADFFINKIGAIGEFEVADWFFLELGVAAIVGHPKHYNVYNYISDELLIENATGGYNFSIASFFVLDDEYLSSAGGVRLSYDNTQFFGDNVNIERVQRFAIMWVQETDFTDRFYMNTAIGGTLKKVNDNKLFEEGYSIMEYLGFQFNVTFGYIIKQ